jgi:hypothetical protein
MSEYEPLMNIGRGTTRADGRACTVRHCGRTSKYGLRRGCGVREVGSAPRSAAGAARAAEGRRYERGWRLQLRGRFLT